MDLEKLIKNYQIEQDIKKKFGILRKILVVAVENKDPKLNKWVRELLGYKPQEFPISQLVNCPNCQKMMTKTKTVKSPPQAEFHYFMCNNCKVERLVVYPTPTSRGVVHLQDTSIYTDIDKLRKYILSHYDVESKIILEKILSQSRDPVIKSFAQYKLGLMIKKTDPINSEKLLELSLQYYLSLKLERNPELEEILQNLVVLKINNNKPKDSLKIIEKLSEYAEKIQDFRLLVVSKINKGVALETMKKYEESADAYSDAMNIAEEKEYPELFNQASARLQKLLDEVEQLDEESVPIEEDE